MMDPQVQPQAMPQVQPPIQPTRLPPAINNQMQTALDSSAHANDPLLAAVPKMNQATTQYGQATQQAATERDKAIQGLGERPKVPEYHEIPPKDATMFMSMMMALGALSGRSTAAPMTAAMNNMTGIMKAQKDNNQEMLAAQKEEFNRNVDAALAKAKEFAEKKQDILEKFNYNMGAADHELKLAELEFGQAEKVSSANRMSAKEQLDAISRFEKTRASVGGLSTDKNTLEMQVERVKNGEKINDVIAGMGNKSAAERAQLSQALAHKLITEEGKTPKEAADFISKMGGEYKGIVAGETSLARRAGMMATSVQEVGELAQQAVKTVDALDRNSFKSINQLSKIVESQWSPEQAKFNVANNSLIMAYSAAAARSGQGSVDSQKHAREMLDSAYSKEVYKAAVEQLMVETKILKEAPAKARENLFEKPAKTVVKTGTHNGKKVVQYSDGTVDYAN